MRSHARGATIFGIGVFAADSKTPKLSITRSTEAEVLATSDHTTKVIFIHLFLEAQGYPLKESMICQDNQSTIRMVQIAGSPVENEQGASMIDVFM